MPKNTAVILFASVVAFVVRPPTARADEGSAASETSVNGWEADLAVPSSPGFSVLGVSPETVERPASGRELAMSIVNNVDANGRPQPGLALDFSPLLTFAGSRYTIGEYRTGSALKRLLARSQLSIATVRDGGAIGARLVLFDGADARMNIKLDDCFQKLKAIPQRQSLFAPIDAGADDALRKAAAQCRTDVEEAQKNNWNKATWIVGGAPTWSTNGETGGYKWNGGAVWSSLSVPIGSTSQFILQVRYRDAEKVADPDHDGQFFVQDSLSAGSRLRFGSPTFAGSLEGTYTSLRRHGADTETSYRIDVAAEKRLAEGLWIDVSIGGDGGRGGTKNKVFVLSALKWATSKTPRLVRAN
jgi:hypothetical protein